MKKRRFLSVLLTIVMLLSAVSPAAYAAETEENPPMMLSLDEDGNLIVSRRIRECIPVGPEGTWTIFVYMCGADLESDGGLATADLQKMLDASTGENVRFVVQTGGTAEWQNYFVEDGCLGRYEICDGTMTEIEILPEDNMGDPNVLLDFLVWGVENYPAARMGLVFWNHGGGSISGACFDENYNSDSLTLNEYSRALEVFTDSVTDVFEFVGFDACLMATVENANMLASFARYMYASEETEPGSGWDYTAIGSALGENPDMDGAELGKVVCDSYFALCECYGREEDATFSVTDLSRIDDVMVTFNAFAKNLFESTYDLGNLSWLMRAVRDADNYGGNNRTEGYTNMMDMAGLVELGTDWVDGVEPVLSAIQDAVIYHRNGEDHSRACGLAIYFPMLLKDNVDLKYSCETAISPYYLAFIDRAAYGLSFSGNIDQYEYAELVLDVWELYWSEYARVNPDSFFENYYVDQWWDAYSLIVDGKSELITFDIEPSVTEDGTAMYCMLSPEGLNCAAAVTGTLYWLADNEEDLISLGSTIQVHVDWEDGLIVDNFTGVWISLPDGQCLQTTLVRQDETEAVYSSPILLNGERTNLRIVHKYETDSLSIDCAWNGIGQNGMASRKRTELKPGDVITPQYTAIELDTMTMIEDYTGLDYVCEDDLSLTYTLLFDGIFYYAFEIEDVFGNYMVTDNATILIEGDEVYFLM